MYRFYCDETLFYKSGVDDQDFYVLSAKLELEKGKTGAFSFSLPNTNVIYDRIQKLKSIITVYDGEDEIFRGRVLYDEKSFNNTKQISCEGELSFLLDSIKRPYEYKGTLNAFFEDLINNHNSQVEKEKRFAVGNITVKDNNDYVSRSSEDYDNTYNVINKKLIETYGGYLKTRVEDGVRYIDYLEEYGEDNDQIIEFGVNLLDIKEYITAENVFTCLIPLGAKDEETGKRLTIGGINAGLDYIENQTAVDLFGKIWKVNKWDDVTVATNLLNKGKAYLESNIEMSVTLTLKAVDLHLMNVNTDRIKEGDKLRVVSLPHNLDHKFECTKIEVNPLDPSNNVYTFGSNYKTLTDPIENLDDKTVMYIGEVVAQGAQGIKNEVINEVKDKLTQEEIMNIITNNGEVEGVFLVGDQIWIDGTYIKADTIEADKLKANSITTDKLAVSTREQIEKASADSSDAINSANANAERIGELSLTSEQFKVSIEELNNALSDTNGDVVTLSNQLQMTTESAQFLKTKTEEIESQIEGKVDYVTIEEWARFDGSTLELGASNSPFKTRISNTELAFWQGSTKVAWLSNNELHVASAVITISIGVGDEENALRLVDEKEDGFSFI